MRIAQVCPYYEPVIGGMEEHIKQISQQLQKKGHKITIHTSNLTRTNKIKKRTEKKNNIQIKRHASWLRVGEFASFWPGFLFDLVTEKYDVVHVHAFRHPHSWLSLIAKLRGSKIVYTTHTEAHAESSKPFLTRFLCKIHDLIIAPATLRFYDKIIVLSKNQKSFFMKNHVKKENLVVLPNGVSKNYFRKVSAKKFKEKYNLKGKVVLFLGRIHKEKGLDFLLKCIPLTQNNVTFVIAGCGEKKYVKMLKKTVKELGVTKRVVFTGTLKGLKKIEAYAACDVFFLPSKQESFGLVLLEAMAQGKPVVATKSVGASSVVEDGINGFLVGYGNVEEASEKINLLLLNEKLAKKIGLNNKKKAKKFSWEKIVDSLEQAYNVKKKEEKKLHIVQVCPYYEPVIGGMEEHIKQISQQLQKKGHKITIHTSNLTRTNKIKKRTEKKNNIQIKRHASLFRLGNYASFWPSVFFELRKENADIIHFHAFRHPHNFTVYFIKKPSLLTIYWSGYFKKPPQFLNQLVKKLFDKFFARRLLKKFDKLIALTDFEKQNIVSFFNIPEKKLVVIPSGIKNSYLKRANGNAFRKKFGISADEKIVLCVGRIHKRKNFDKVLKVIPKFKNQKVKFVFVGPDGGFQRNLKVLSRKLNILEKVVFTGQVSEEEKMQAYAASNIFVNPSDDESFGLVVLEAMSQNNAVVVSSEGALPAVVGKDGLVFKSNDLRDLEKKLQLLINNDTLRKDLAKRGLKKAKQFTWERIAEQHEKIYLEILKNLK